MTSLPDSWFRNRRPLVFAHRGACRVAPENTLAAFRRAVQLGADGVELDVQLSKDGVPVVIHDENLQTTTNGCGRVSYRTLPYLQTLDAGSHFSSDFAGERLPTLAEVLAEIASEVLVNIELKGYKRDIKSLPAAVYKTVKQCGCEDRVWFSSFRFALLREMQTIAPSIPCGWLLESNGHSTRSRSQLAQIDVIHPHCSMITDLYMENARIHGHGQDVVTWTVDDVVTAQRLAAMGVAVLISNVPDRIAAGLNR